MKHSIEKMRACLPLLPAPGEEVVAECLDEIESLRQQLAAAQLEREAMKIEWDKAYEIAALANHRLAAALAACKLKDDALEGLIDTMDLRLDDDDLSLETRTAFEALTIQPDDSALKAWLEMSNTADCRSQSSLQGVVK